MCAPFAVEHDPVEAGKLFTFEALEASYRECRKRKRGTRNALRFEADLESNLLDLLEELKSGKYRPRRSVCFLSTKPKIREIIAADFRDRIVHHFLVSRLEPVFEKRFIHDSYASRKGKGTHAAVDRLKVFIGKVTRNHTRRCWFAHLDIRNFFMTIDREVLYRLVARRISFSSTLRRLSSILIFHDPTRNAIWKGDRDERARIPPGKSLFDVPAGKGLPIGNHTSQFFANVYMNELDQFVKRKLKIKFYIRYVDDMMLLNESREKLFQLKSKIAGFLLKHLCLRLNERCSRIAPVSSGIDFLGYVSHQRHRLLRRRVTVNLVEKLENLSGCIVVEWRGYSWILY